MNDTWFHFECIIDIHGTTGRFRYWIDERLEGDIENLNTAGEAAIDGIEWYTRSIAGSMYIDDLYITDGSENIGVCRSVYLPPAADTAQKDWVPNSGGTNYTQVDDYPHDGDTTHLTALANGDRDMYTVTPIETVLGYTPASIEGVNAIATARRTDSVARSIKTIIKSGGVDYESSETTIASTFKHHQACYGVNPNGNAAWTPETVNALQVGIEGVTTE